MPNRTFFFSEDELARRDAILRNINSGNDVTYMYLHKGQEPSEPSTPDHHYSIPSEPCLPDHYNIPSEPSLPDHYSIPSESSVADHYSSPSEPSLPNHYNIPIEPKLQECAFNKVPVLSDYHNLSGERNDDGHYDELTVGNDIQVAVPVLSDHHNLSSERNDDGHYDELTVDNDIQVAGDSVVVLPEYHSMDTEESAISIDQEGVPKEEKAVINEVKAAPNEEKAVQSNYLVVEIG
eukprot:Awhi_evm2s7105